MKFAEEVSGEDVQEAARLINVATQRVCLCVLFDVQAATDPRTGVINMSSIYTEEGLQKDQL